jgi:hypothetical protein
MSKSKYSSLFPIQTVKDDIGKIVYASEKNKIYDMTKAHQTEAKVKLPGSHVQG